MKIIQILPEMNVGGVERGTLDLANILVQKGHDSLVISNGGELIEALEEGGTRHILLPVHKKSLLSVMRCVKEVRKILLEEKPDIIHARSRIPALIAYFAARHTNTHFVTTCHGYYSMNFFSHIMGWGKLVIVISQIIGRHMIEDFKVRPENIRLIHRSVDLDKFHFRQRKLGQSTFTISIVGRLTTLKGHSYFLEAMARVLRQMPYARVLVIGDAPKNKPEYRQRLELLAKRLGIAEQVTFLGNRRDIPELLRESDILVMSTITQEAFGRVLIEAQAVGVPVVATNVGGVVDIVEHEKTGLLVPPRDSAAMANAVLRLMRDPKLVDEMVCEARKRVESLYTLEQMAEKTMEVYQEAVQSLNILVIKLSAVGDVILASASFKALRKKYPQAKIVCLVGQAGAAMIQGCPYLDDVLVYDHKGRDKGMFGFWRVLKKIRKYRFDKIIDFQNTNRTHLLGFFSASGATYGYKNKKWGSLLTNGILDDKPNVPPVQHQFQVLKQLGIEYNDRCRLQMWPRPDDIVYAKELLNSEWIDEKKHTIIGVNISASERWPTKNWPMKHLAELCDRLSSENIRIVITGMAKDKMWVKELRGYLKSKPAIVVGKTNLLQLAAIISRCKVYLTSDSAPLHVAAAMNVPVLAFFGPTAPERHLPPGDNIVVLRKKVACHPCYETRCKVGTHICMQDISVDEVMSALKEYL